MVNRRTAFLLFTIYYLRFTNFYVALRQFGHEEVGRDGAFLRDCASLCGLAARHHLRDDRGREGGGAHHGAEARALVEAVDDVVAERALSATALAPKLQANQDRVRLVRGEMTQQQLAQHAARPHPP